MTETPREHISLNIPPENNKNQNIYYPSEVVDDLRRQINTIAQKESLAVNYLKWVVIFTFTLVLSVLGLNLYSTIKLDGALKQAEDAVREAKNEVRQIAGRARPDDVSFGRTEPGDSDTLVFYVSIDPRPNEEAGVSLKFQTSPYIEVKGQQATYLGWRYTLSDELLDWFSSTSEFDHHETEDRNDKYLEYRRSLRSFGDVAWYTFGNEPVPITILPNTPFNPNFSLSVSYETCERAQSVLALLLKNDQEAMEINSIYLTPLIANYPVEAKRFKAELVFPGSLETACSPHEENINTQFLVGDE